MRQSSTAKKPVVEVVEDWHIADVIAAVRKAGTSLSALSRQHGYHPRSLSVVLRRAWPRGEKIVAARIGLRPQVIWPSRYDEHGHPKPRAAKQKDNTAPLAARERAA